MVPCATTEQNVKKTIKKKMNKKQPVRLYSRGIVLGYRRSRSNQYPSCSLLKIEGVNTLKDTAYYLGKKVAYIYKGKTVKKGNKYRIIWGKVRRPHGNSGAVRAKFTRNLPPHAFGKRVRVFLYPSSV